MKKLLPLYTSKSLKNEQIHFSMVVLQISLDRNLIT